MKEYILQRDFIIGIVKSWKDLDVMEATPSNLKILKDAKWKYEAGTNSIRYRIIERTTTEKVML